jgi:hypothetical protein
MKIKEKCERRFASLWIGTHGGRLYRAIISKIARKVPTDGLHVNKVEKNVDELFQTRPTEQIRIADDECNSDDGEDNTLITEYDLLVAITKINPKKLREWAAYQGQ